jgi:hypothetical protein
MEEHEGAPKRRMTVPLEWVKEKDPCIHSCWNYLIGIYHDDSCAYPMGFKDDQTLFDLCKASSADFRSQAPAYQGLE